MSLPRRFCWTRFGTEAGEGIGQILTRKERERVLNRGMFLWGIGNAIGPSMRQLLKLEVKPEVVFSPIRSAPRREDISPNQIIVWRAGRTLDGQHYQIPAGSIVTSRSKLGEKHQRHYALVCMSSSELHIDPEGGTLAFSRLRNLLTDRLVGASQVTAVVHQTDHDFGDSVPSYQVAMRARLVFPYFIELLDPVHVPQGPNGRTVDGPDGSISSINFVLDNDPD